MFKVGLTGSIAVGKSFVCSVLADLGCSVLDADQTARDVVQPGTDGLRLVVDAFGAVVLLPDGSLDRKKLGSIIFSEPGKRQLLNSILHPLIIERQDQWIKEQEMSGAGVIAVIDAALMIESGGYQRFDKLIVVWCRGDIQLQRLMDRNLIGRNEAEAMIKSQMPQDEKKKYADFLIDTSDDFDQTRVNSEAIYSKMLEFTAN